MKEVGLFLGVLLPRRLSGICLYGRFNVALPLLFNVINFSENNFLREILEDFTVNLYFLPGIEKVTEDQV